MLTDPIRVMLLVVESMEKLGIPYLIGGSLASSIHGIARATRDADIIADIQEKHAEVLADGLKDRFYVDSEVIKEAIRHRSFFNFIHLDSMFKIDVYILKQDAFSKEEFKRRKRIVVNLSPEKTAYVATPEDTILSKLEWFRMGGEISDRQWNDVLGILKVQRGRLDMDYLQRWARELNLADLFKRSLEEAEIDV